MTRRKVVLLISILIVLLMLAGTALLLTMPKKSEEQNGIKLLSSRSINEVARVDIKTEKDNYSVLQEGGGFSLGDIPAEVVNVEYLRMLLEEISRIEYITIVEEKSDSLEKYGLDKPESQVSAAYTDGQTLELWIGAKEPISDGRYVLNLKTGAVYLLDNSRTIRFTMPIEKYIDFIIIPPNETPSVLDAIKNASFKGKKLPKPIEIKAVTNNDKELLRKAVSYGAVTHMIVSPVLHEMDQGEAIKLFESLAGMISDGVEAFNATPQQLSLFGFDEPDIEAKFDFQPNKNAPLRQYGIKVCNYKGQMLLTRNDEGVVYRISDEYFTGLSYEKLVSRWFLSPLIIDVAKIKLELNGEAYTFDLKGEKNDELEVTCNGSLLDTGLFRKYYNLLVSASNDGRLIENPALAGSPLMKLKFIYKDKEKPGDEIVIWQGDLRRVYVSVNGIAEFAMRDKYLACITEALGKLLNNQVFDTDW